MMTNLYRILLLSAVILLTANCTKMHKVERQVLEQGGTIVVKSNAANASKTDYIIWWSADSVLYYYSPFEDKTIVLYSPIDSIKADSIYNVASKQKERLWFADSVAVSYDNSALIFFPPGNDPLFWENVTNSCRLLSLQTLCFIPIDYPNGNSYFYYAESPIAENSNVFYSIKYGVHAIDLHLSRESSKADLFFYDRDYRLELGKIEYQRVKNQKFVRGLIGIEQVHDKLWDVADQQYIRLNEFGHYFFRYALNELNIYMDGDTPWNLLSPYTLDDWLINVEGITERKIKYALTEGVKEKLTAEAITILLLEDNKVVESIIKLDEDFVLLDKALDDLDNAFEDLERALEDWGNNYEN